MRKTSCLILLISLFILFPNIKVNANESTIRYLSLSKDKTSIVVNWNEVEGAKGYIVNLYKGKSSPVAFTTATKEETTAKIEYDKNCKFLELLVIKESGTSKIDFVELNFNGETGNLKNNKPIILGVSDLDTELEVKLDPYFKIKNMELIIKNSNNQIIDKYSGEGKLSVITKKPTTKNFKIELLGELLNEEIIFDSYEGERFIESENIIFNKRIVEDKFVYRVLRTDIKSLIVRYYGTSLDAPLKEVNITNIVDNLFEIDKDVTNAKMIEFTFILNNGHEKVEIDGLELGVPDEETREQEIIEPFIFIVNYPSTKVITALTERIPVKTNPSTLTDVIVNKTIVYQRVPSNMLDRMIIPLLEGSNEVFIKSYDRYGNYKTFSTHIMCVSPEEMKGIKKRQGDLEIVLDKTYDDILYKSNQVKIDGIVNNGDSLTVNGSEVKLTSDGRFSFLFKMNEGENEIAFEAKGGNRETLKQKLILRHQVDDNIINSKNIKIEEIPTKIIPEDFELPKEKESSKNLDNDKKSLPVELENENNSKLPIIICFLALLTAVGIPLYKFFSKK